MGNCVRGGAYRLILTIQGSGHGLYKVILTRRPVLKNDSTVEGLALSASPLRFANALGVSGAGHVTAPMPAATLPTESRVECCSQVSVTRGMCVCVSVSTRVSGHEGVWGGKLGLAVRCLSFARTVSGDLTTSGVLVGIDGSRVGSVVAKVSRSLELQKMGLCHAVPESKISE